MYHVIPVHSICLVYSTCLLYAWPVWYISLFITNGIFRYLLTEYKYVTYHMRMRRRAITTMFLRLTDSCANLCQISDLVPIRTNSYQFWNWHGVKYLENGKYNFSETQFVDKPHCEWRTSPPENFTWKFNGGVVRGGVVHGVEWSTPPRTFCPRAVV